MNDDQRKYYGFRREPFEHIDNPDEMFVARSQVRIAENIIEEVLGGCDIVAVRGASGAGTTSLMRMLASMIQAPRLPTVETSDPGLNPLDMQSRLAEASGIGDPIADPDRMLETMREEKGIQRLILLIDNAEALPAVTYRYLWQLLDVSRPATVMLQIVLLGKLGPWAGLQDPQLERMRNATSSCYMIFGLHENEAEDYLDHRLRRAGRSRRRVMSRAAMAELLVRSDCLPGRLNALAETALASGYRNGPRRLSLKKLRRALDDDASPHSPGPVRRPMLEMSLRWASVGVLLLTVAATGTFVALFTPNERAPRQAASILTLRPQRLQKLMTQFIPAPSIPIATSPARKAVSATFVVDMPLRPLQSRAVFETVEQDLQAPAARTVAAASLAAPDAQSPSGLAFVAAPGDSLQSLYAEAYRGLTAPPYAVFAAANRAGIKPGAIVFFPDPPGGWVRR